MSQFVSKWATPSSDQTSSMSETASQPVRQGVALSKWAAALKDPIPQPSPTVSPKSPLKSTKKDHRNHKDKFGSKQHLDGNTHHLSDKAPVRIHGDTNVAHRQHSGSTSTHSEKGFNHHHGGTHDITQKDTCGPHGHKHAKQAHIANDKNISQHAPHKHQHKHQLTLPPPSRDERAPKKPNGRAAALLEATTNTTPKAAPNRRKSNDLHARSSLTPAAKVLADRLGPVDRSDKPYQPHVAKPIPINNRLNALLDTPIKGPVKKVGEPSLASRLAQKPDPRKQREELENRRKEKAEKEALEQERLLKMLDEIDTKNMDWASFED